MEVLTLRYSVFFYGILFNMAIHGLNTDFYQYETSSFEKDTVIYCS